MKGIEIDLGLVDLIQALWDNNVTTIQCCQGGDIKDKHSFIKCFDGNYQTTYVDNGVIKEKAHLIFDINDIDKVSHILPNDITFIIGDKTKSIEYFESWLGTFNGVWVSWIL